MYTREREIPSSLAISLGLVFSNASRRISCDSTGASKRQDGRGAIVNSHGVSACFERPVRTAPLVAEQFCAFSGDAADHGDDAGGIVGFWQEIPAGYEVLTF